MSMLVSDINATALSAFSTGLAVTAHNIANVNTHGFIPSHTTYEDLSYNHGVQVADVSKDSFAPREPVEMMGLQTGHGLDPLMLNPSQTDLAREMVGLVTTQRAYEANAVAFTVGDEMIGALLDIKA